MIVAECIDMQGYLAMSASEEFLGETNQFGSLRLKKKT